MERATEIVIELLAKGSSQVEVARITGNSESAISQVFNKYHVDIATKSADKTLAEGAHSAKLDTLEALAAAKLESLLPLETDSMKVLKIFQGLNSAVRRDRGEAPVGGNTTNVVQLQLPSHIRQQAEVVVNPNNDVVAVDGRDLTPATMKEVNNLAGIRTEAEKVEIVHNEQAYDEIMQAAFTV